MPTLITTLIHSFQQHASQLNGKRVWLACSGGRDSMALAHLTHSLYLQGDLPFCPQLIHVNHGLQQANNDWAEQVKQWSVIHNLPCHILHANVQGADEQSARNARYQTMATMMGQNDVLMLAHHADDQAETMLMRLFNGAGVAGLSAMKAWTSRQIDGKQINLWRPWLTAPRSEITAYAQANELPYIDDPTNLMGNNKRSWLRSQLMPIIQQQYPQAVANMSRSAELIANADEVLTAEAIEWQNRASNQQLTYAPYQQVLDIDKLQKLSHAQLSLLIHNWLQGYKATEPLPPSKQRVDTVIELIKRRDNDHQTQIDWQGSQHYRVCRYRNQLYRLRADWLAWLKLPINTRIYKAQPTRSNNQNYIVVKDDGNMSWQVGLNTLNLENMLEQAQEIKVSPLTREDKITLAGHGVAKSGKKLLQDLAIPAWERDSVALILVDDVPVILCTPVKEWQLR